MEFFINHSIIHLSLACQAPYFFDFIYSAFPQYKVFIDSRVDMYGVDRLKDYLDMVYFKPGWENIVEKYNIHWVIFNADSILSRPLAGRNDWKLIYPDKVANIFIKKYLKIRIS